MTEKSNAPSSGTAEPAKLVQYKYELRPRETDDHRDIHVYDFGPEGAPYGSTRVDLAVAGGVNYPLRVGVRFAVQEIGSHVRLSGEAGPWHDQR